MRNRRPDVFLENVYLCIQAILASLSCVGLLLLYRALTLSEKNSETFASSIFTSLESYRAIFLIVFFCWSDILLFLLSQQGSAVQMLI